MSKSALIEELGVKPWRHRVVITQAGGKYGTFLCPICSNTNALFKFSASCGSCDKCNSQFCVTDGEWIDDGNISVIDLDDC